MDGQAILESLDDLWFFSSVFTSPTPPPPPPPVFISSCGDGSTEQPHLKDPPRTEQPHMKDPPRTEQPHLKDLPRTEQPHLKDPLRTEQPKPRTPTLLKQPIGSPNTEILVETSSKSKESSNETEMQIMESLEVGGLESSPESPWRGRKPRKEKKCCNFSMKKRKNHRWQEVFEMDFSHREVLVFPGLQRMEKMCGFQKLESLYHMKKMPPLTDGTAMKEHLKSWAYAVACTVK